MPLKWRSSSPINTQKMDAGSLTLKFFARRGFGFAASGEARLCLARLAAAYPGAAPLDWALSFVLAVDLYLQQAKPETRGVAPNLKGR
jgi:hypothetical protein